MRATGTPPRPHAAASCRPPGGPCWPGVAAATGGQVLSRRFDVAAERAELTLPTPARPADAIPAAPTPRSRGCRPSSRPNDRFYRIDTNLTVPSLSADGWTLRIHGMVDQERTFTYRELLDMPSIELPLTLTCVSNEVGGDLVGTAVWQGVRLADLLDMVGVSDDADAARRACLRRLHHRDAGGGRLTTGRRLVAYGMNGEPLPAGPRLPRCGWSPRGCTATCPPPSG